jgi:hypothetical protein
MMNPQERGQFTADVYKLQCDLFSLLERCRVTNSISFGTDIQRALDPVNELLEELKPEIPVCAGVVPTHSPFRRMDFPRHKF